MRFKNLKLLTVIGLFVFTSVISNGQSCIPTNINGTNINLLCNQTCTTMVFKVPHIKSTEDYVVNSIPYTPYPYQALGGVQLTAIYTDDVFSSTIPIPFPFCFYGATYNSCVIGSNGVLSFDISNANGANSWPLTSSGGSGTPIPIPYAGGTQNSSSSTYYPKASIMGPYHDIYPTNSNGGLRRIEYSIVGTAPCRKFVTSFYKVPYFSCTSISATHQIVINESTGLVEIYIGEKPVCSSWNSGLAILGIQDFTRTKAVAAPGKNCTVWNESLTGYRFTPNGTTSLYSISELLDMTGTVVATADTLTTTPGLLDIRFQNFCPPAGNNQYVVRTSFKACDNPANLLTSLDTITISRVNSLGATASKTDATCGPADGTITVTVPAGVGTPPYTYVLDGGAPVVGPSPYTFTGVAAGAHTIVVTDNSGGCTSTINISVSLTGNISSSLTKTDAACTGVNNGAITVTSASGIGPYTFSLNGGAAVSGTIPYTFSGLAPGNYTVKVNDIGTGCTSAIMSIFVGMGTGITTNISTTPTACTGVNNGTITVTAITGTAPYNWQIDGGAVVLGGSPHTFTSLSPGTHNVAITDAVGCLYNAVVTVGFGAGVSGTITPTATTCPTAADGKIMINAIAGTAPYTYSLDGGAAQSGANPYTFSNLAAGPHTIVITDNVGCQFTANVTVFAGPSLTATVLPSATSCNGASDGSILVTPNSGTAPFLYSIDAGAPVSGGANHTFTGLSSGSHTIMVTDASGCATSLITVNVTAGPQLTATTTPTATSCNGANNGSILVAPNSGTAPYLYILDGGAPVSAGANHTFSNLNPGAHTIKVTDASGCSTTLINVNIATGPQLITTATSTDVLCFGDANGVITVATPTIGTAPYQYSLDNVTWQNSNVFNGLTAGPYTVYFKEAAGCQGSLTITVNGPTALATNATTVPVICHGQNNGVITITANGGITPYQYSIDNGVTWQSSNIFNVAQGAYTILIKDFNGCTKTQTVTVTEPAQLTANSINGNASCAGGNDGVITVNASGGNTNYTYSIDGVNFQAANVFNVAPGNYTITVKDNLGCTTTFTTTVGLTNNLTLTPQADPTICESKSVQLNLISNAVSYSWSPATALSNANISNPIANPIVTTQYIATATLGICVAYDTVIVYVNPAPIPNAGPDGLICYGQSYQLQGSGGVQYTWTPSTYLNFTNISNPTSTPSKTITYTLTKVIDANGCESLTTDQVTIDVTPPIKVTTFPFDTIGYPGDQFMINTTTNVPNISTYTWTPTFGLSDPTIANPIVTVGPIGSDVLYQLKVSTAAGCKGEGYVNIKVYNGPELYTPTGFTPNGDGLNDKFYPFPVGIKSLNYFRVFNRWGQLVYSTTTLMAGWDGKLAGVDQPSGVYVYMAEGVDKNGKKITKKGTVALIR